MIGESRHTRHNTSCHFVSKNHLIIFPFFQRTTKHAFFRFIIYSFGWCFFFFHFLAIPSNGCYFDDTLQRNCLIRNSFGRVIIFVFSRCAFTTLRFFYRFELFVSLGVCVFFLKKDVQYSSVSYVDFITFSYIYLLHIWFVEWLLLLLQLSIKQIFRFASIDQEMVFAITAIIL